MPLIRPRPKSISVTKALAIELNVTIDGLLATALRGETAVWLNISNAGSDDRYIRDKVVERALYHGVAGLLVETEGTLHGWPAEVLKCLRGEAVARAMWEMQHRAVLAKLLADLAQHDIGCALLKGTALAYDLYANPATRTRGDTDILIARSDLAQA